MSNRYRCDFCKDGGCTFCRPKEDKEDKVSQDKNWEFNKEVTDCFDDMLSRSIPQYDVMRETVASLSKRFIRPKDTIIDIGCSRGESISRILTKDSYFYGLECSVPMFNAATERFKDNGNVAISNYDLRAGIPLAISNCNLIISTLTIQFIPIEYRQFIIQSIYDKLNPGGAFIIVEKVLGANSYIDRLMIMTYLDLKRSNGYTEQQIQRKKMALEGVLVPVTAKWNEELLKMAGFKHIDCFWRWMNFAGWIAIK